MVRSRVWANHHGEDYGLAYNLRLAERAKAANLAIYLDLHYSLTWADPTFQATPLEWQGLGIDDLAKRVFEYTKNVLDSFQEKGIEVEMVSIGNEILTGLLFPVGKMMTPDGPINISKLLKSASDGVKSSTLEKKPKIAIHLEGGTDWKTMEWWYDTVLGSGGPLKLSDFHVMAVSYYPYYGEKATLAALSTSLRNLKAKYHKDVMIAEFGWPSFCSNPDYPFPPDTKRFPISAAGQAQFIIAIADIIEDVQGLGASYWEAGWFTNPKLGSTCEWVSLFDKNGRAMEGLAAFKSI